MLVVPAACWCRAPWPVLGIEVELAPLAAVEIPVCIIATIVAVVFYVLKDRRMVQKYYK